MEAITILTMLLFSMIIIALAIGIFTLVCFIYDEANEKTQTMLFGIHMIPMFISVLPMSDKFSLSFISNGNLFALCMLYYVVWFFAMIAYNANERK